jgi:ligand-binding SRPBCC domain-containing protein
MPVIRLTTRIRAPIATVFDLSRSVDLHLASAAQTGERAIAGRTAGLMALDEEVTWEALHFCVRQRLTVKITRCDRPHHFRDTMVRGIFKRFDHDHHFTAEGDTTIMDDTFDFTAPLGLLGRLADGAFLARYMRAFLVRRNLVIVQVAESGDAARFLGGP